MQPSRSNVVGHLDLRANFLQFFKSPQFRGAGVSGSYYAKGLPILDVLA